MVEWRGGVIDPDEFEKQFRKRLRGRFQRNCFNPDPDYDDIDGRLAALARNVLYEHIFDEAATPEETTDG